MGGQAGAMHRFGMMWGAAALMVGVVVLAGVAGAAAGRDDGGSGWRFVKKDSSLWPSGRLVVFDRDSAWAFGADIGWRDDRADPTAFRWDGRRWRRSEIPAGHAVITAAGGVSAADLWVGTSAGRLLHWDGRAWTIVKRLAGMQITDVQAIGPDDVWVFATGGPGSGGVAWHRTAGGWTRTAMPFDFVNADAVASDDIWAVGMVGETPRPVVGHYDGRAWRIVPTGLRQESGHAYSGITATRQGIWITDSVNGFTEVPRSGRAGPVELTPHIDSVLLHRDEQGRWSSERLLDKAGRWRDGVAPVPDGKGGVWLLGSTDVNGYDSALVHRSADGRLTRTPVTPTAELTSLARIPGTDRLLATGTVHGGFRARSGVLSSG